MSVVVHEVAHGYAALWLGDSTAKYEGRLTINPLKHLDPFGSIILPLLLFLTNAGFIVGWAKPVPFNPYNLRNARWGEALVAVAGPLSNIILALIFGLFLRLALAAGLVLSTPILKIISIIVIINLVLAIFNLVPIPPLDGSKILFSILPRQALKYRGFLERYGFFIVIIFIIGFGGVLAPVVGELFSLITGLYI